MKYSQFFRENAGKKVEITMTDGDLIKGKLTGYISAEDNEPESESIIVDNTELFTDEISNVSVTE